jgi:hypothetical protein
MMVGARDEIFRMSLLPPIEKSGPYTDYEPALSYLKQRIFYLI